MKQEQQPPVMGLAELVHWHTLTICAPCPYRCVQTIRKKSESRLGGLAGVRIGARTLRPPSRSRKKIPPKNISKTKKKHTRTLTSAATQRRPSLPSETLLKYEIAIGRLISGCRRRGQAPDADTERATPRIREPCPYRVSQTGRSLVVDSF